MKKITQLTGILLLSFLAISCSKKNQDDPYYNDYNNYNNYNNNNNGNFYPNSANYNSNYNTNFIGNSHSQYQRDGHFASGSAFNHGISFNLRSNVRSGRVFVDGNLQVNQSACGLNPGSYVLSTQTPGILQNNGSAQGIRLRPLVSRYNNNRYYNNNNNRNFGHSQQHRDYPTPSVNVEIATLQKGGPVTGGPGFYANLRINGCTYLFNAFN